MSYYLDGVEISAPFVGYGRAERRAERRNRELQPTILETQKITDALENPNNSSRKRKRILAALGALAAVGAVGAAGTVGYRNRDRIKSFYNGVENPLDAEDPEELESKTQRLLAEMEKAVRDLSAKQQAKDLVEDPEEKEKEAERQVLAEQKLQDVRGAVEAFRQLEKDKMENNRRKSARLQALALKELERSRHIQEEVQD